MTEAHRSASELIAAKTRVPAPRPEFIERTRLLERIAGDADPIVLIEAPAGYGKSTLLQQWAARERRPVAFVRLDRSESDPVVFWRYLVAALKAIEPDLVTGAERELEGAMPVVDEVVVPRLLNALDGYDEHIVLMLDDFHRIEGLSVPSSLGVLMENIPSTLTLAIATRPEKRLALAALRARGLVHDVDVSELRFSLDETAAAVTKINHGRSEREIRDIHLRTEGWATGVFLAGRTGTPLPPVGPQPQIHHYLVTEMLDELDPADREFMLKASVLDVLDPDVCDVVTGQPDSAERLRRLSRSNVLLIQLGPAASYRYHHLLLDVLRSELRATRGSDAIAVLHDRAYRWMLEHGQLSEAIHHAILARATGEAVAIVCGSWFEEAMVGRVATAHQWLGWFDDADFSAHPPLAVAAAHVSAFVGDVDGAERFSRLASRLTHVGDPLDGSSTYEASVAIMSCTLGLDGPSAAVIQAERALALEPEGSPWRPLVEAILGVTRVMESDDPSQDGLVIRAAGSPAGPLGAATYALGSLALINAWRGRWGTAETYAADAMELIEQLGLGSLVTSGIPYAVCAVISARKGDTARARQLLAVAERSSKQAGGLPFESLLLALTTAEALLGLSQPDRAMEHLENAQRTLVRLGDGGRAEYRLNRFVREADHAVRRSHDVSEAAPLLTARELQVLGLLRTGLTLEQIGERLYISRDTVKTHASQSYRKLGVHGRDEAVKEAVQLGIL